MATNNTSIFGMIRAQRIARKIKRRAAFLVSEKRRRENVGKIFIDHTDEPRKHVEFADQISLLGPLNMHSTLSTSRYLSLSSSKAPYMGSSSRLTSATQRQEQREVYNPHLYKLEPSKRFYEPDVRKVIKDVLDSNLNGQNYNPEVFPNTARFLAELIKEKVKSFNYPRYKIISIVYIGQLREQGTRIVSMCLFDKRLDNFAQYRYEGNDFYAVGVVYGCYME